MHKSTGEDDAEAPPEFDWSNVNCDNVDQVMEDVLNEIKNMQTTETDLRDKKAEFLRIMGLIQGKISTNIQAMKDGKSPNMAKPE